VRAQWIIGALDSQSLGLREVAGTSAQDATVCGKRSPLANTATVVMLLTFILSIISIPSPLTPSFQAYNLPFLQILTTAAFPFLLQD